MSYPVNKVFYPVIIVFYPIILIQNNKSNLTITIFFMVYRSVLEIVQDKELRVHRQYVFQSFNPSLIPSVKNILKSI